MIETVVKLIVPIFSLAIIMYLIRAVKGPTIPDIVLAIDCIGYDLAAFMGILSLYFKSPYLISGAIVLALWSYLLDIYVSRYLLREVGG
ncbi:monovalent cation/H+ antiporter complex subunit F [Pyrococcus kukulkanii]|uniref:monovalent cation/H+ antiporter complex subunit F n=1 Tax=Pyrococcus kukulkanii TaxID=1609559 RepID=UPI003564434A